MKKYVCNKHYTPGQIEADDENGFCETERRHILIDETAMTFSFKYEYYFEDEGPNYKIYRRDQNTTSFTGPITKDNGKWVATFQHGVQCAKDLLHKKYLCNSKELSGRIVFACDENSLKIESFSLSPPKLHQKDTILRVGQIYNLHQQ